VIAATDRGLVALSFERNPDVVVDVLARRLSPRIVRAPKRVDRVRRELDEYFSGRRQSFDMPLDWSLVHGFNRKVLEATARIPFGGVSTYSDMARSAGSPRGARAAGNALHNNPIPIVVPCHRVLHRDGGLGGYGGGLPMKRFLLKLEGALDDD
jgi:methylated-DNA-[protein]-cysteine S-methyltransferase